MLYQTHQFRNNIWMNLSLNSSHHLIQESKYSLPGGAVQIRKGERARETLGEVGGDIISDPTLLTPCFSVMLELELWPNCHVAGTLKSYGMLFSVPLFPCFLLERKFIF